MANKTVYFLIDCSGSMHGNRADAVNRAMGKVVTEAIPSILASKNADLNITFCALGFSDAYQGGNVFTILPKTPLEQISQWDDIPQANFNGGTPTGAAIEAVINDLEGGAYGDYDPQTVAPVIILISDGLPNGQNPSYEEALANQSKMFVGSIRIALGMDVDDEGKQSLERFGKVSKRMSESGLATYYDCSENYVDKFVEILKHVTKIASVGR